MSWTKRIVAGSALAASAIMFTPKPAEAGVVVSSSGPSAGQYPVGRQIASSATITLRDGDTVTILENGGTRVFRGAGPHSLGSASAASSNRAFASLTTQRAAARARTGAVRSTGSTEVSNPSLWYVDVTKPGTVCLPAGSNVRLWRADTQAASTYAIAAEGSDAATSVTFPAGEMLAGWGAGSAPAPGTAYRIGHGINTGPVEVRFVFLDQVPEAPEDLAAALIANGCMVQIEQISAAMMTTE
jgi:hypothetical protein